MAGDRLAGQERALQIDAEHTVEILLLEVEEIGGMDDAGIVDEHIDLPERFDRSGDQAFDIGAAGNAGLVESNLAVFRQFFDRLGASGFVDVGDHDLRAVGDETLRDCIADAACAAGHDGRLAAEVHGMLL